MVSLVSLLFCIVNPSWPFYIWESLDYLWSPSRISLRSLTFPLLCNWYWQIFWQTSFPLIFWWYKPFTTQELSHWIRLLEDKEIHWHHGQIRTLCTNQHTINNLLISNIPLFILLYRCLEWSCKNSFKSIIDHEGHILARPAGIVGLAKTCLLYSNSFIRAINL